jgi:hypothetical protein
MKIGDKVNLQGKNYEIVGNHKRSLLLQDERGVKYKITEARLERMLSGAPPKPRKPAQRRVFEGSIPQDEKSILRRLSDIECELSPENLTCDGEAPRYYVREKASRLNAEKRALIAALGRTPTDKELYGVAEEKVEERRKRLGI